MYDFSEEIPIGNGEDSHQVANKGMDWIKSEQAKDAGISWLKANLRTNCDIKLNIIVQKKIYTQMILTIII